MAVINQQNIRVVTLSVYTDENSFPNDNTLDDIDDSILQLNNRT